MLTPDLELLEEFPFLTGSPCRSWRLSNWSALSGSTPIVALLQHLFSVQGPPSRT